MPPGAWQEAKVTIFLKVTAPNVSCHIGKIIGSAVIQKGKLIHTYCS